MKFSNEEAEGSVAAIAKWGQERVWGPSLQDKKQRQALTLETPVTVEL